MRERQDGISAKLRRRAESAAASGAYPPSVLLEACPRCLAVAGQFCWASRTVRGRRVAAQVPHAERVELSQLGEGGR